MIGHNCRFLNTSRRQIPSKNSIFIAQIEKWPHRWVFARTDGKRSRTERQSVRTDRIIAARTGKSPHGTNFARTQREIARTGQFRGCGKRFWRARRKVGAHGVIHCPHGWNYRRTDRKTCARNGFQPHRPANHPHEANFRRPNRLHAIRC